MPLSTGEMNFARSWIGDVDAESDQIFLERFERYLAKSGDQDGALAQAINESMRAQLTALTQGPASVTLPGGVSFSTGQNMTTLMAAIREFRNQTSIANGISRIRRPSTR